jgi:glycosyltransferase involved in cell wall biosynthesis
MITVMKIKPELSIVIPIYNEQEILQETLVYLARFFDLLIAKKNWEFVIVDNGSHDQSQEILQEFSSQRQNVKILYLAKPNYGNALRTGVLASQGEYIKILDIDQWDILFMHWAWKNRKRFDLFIASKRADPTLNNQHWLRWLLSMLLNLSLQFLFNYSGTDTHGPKLLKTRALQSVFVESNSDRGQYDTEVVLRSLRLGLKVIEAPVVYNDKRRPRNAIFKKIVWNVVAITKLWLKLRHVPFKSPQRLYRVSRKELTTSAKRHALSTQLGPHLSKYGQW